MSIKIRIFIAILAVVMLILLTRMIKKKKVDLKDSLFWYFLCILVIVIDIIPDILYALASMLGIAVPSNMIFLLAILLLIIISFSLTATISRLSYKVRRLTQEVALLNEKSKTINKR